MKKIAYAVMTLFLTSVAVAGEGPQSLLQIEGPAVTGLRAFCDKSLGTKKRCTIYFKDYGDQIKKLLKLISYHREKSEFDGDQDARRCVESLNFERIRINQLDLFRYKPNQITESGELQLSSVFSFFFDEQTNEVYKFENKISFADPVRFADPVEMGPQLRGNGAPKVLPRCPSFPFEMNSEARAYNNADLPDSFFCYAPYGINNDYIVFSYSKNRESIKTLIKYLDANYWEDLLRDLPQVCK